MKILYITTIGETMGFFTNLIKKLIDEGNSVDIATNEFESPVPECYRTWGCSIYGISTSRSPFSLGNFKAIEEIRAIAANYDIVHCHTPLAAMATRVACRGLRKQGLKVIYTAHGFHFYKGAPLKNWIIYYPVEKICACWTDVLITINREDYEIAKKKLKSKRIEYIPGVGIDTKKFTDVVVDRDKKREEIGVPKDAKLILSVGELNENKNHQIVIRALSSISDSTIHYVIAGCGIKKRELENLAKENNVSVHLLGYRNDVAELYKVSDVFILPSIREGLNVSIMEAMSSKLPCIVSNIRGNVDMISNMDCLINPFDVESVSEAITKVLTDCTTDKYKSNKISIYDVEYINNIIIRLYEEIYT